MYYLRFLCVLQTLQVLKVVLEAKFGAEEELKSSGLAYTIVRPGGLLNGVIFNHHFPFLIAVFVFGLMNVRVLKGRNLSKCRGKPRNIFQHFVYSSEFQTIQCRL